MKVIICENIEEFNAIQDRIYVQRKLEGHIDKNTTACVNPLYHPTDGRIALVIETRIEKYLTADELERVVELPDDWFPVIEE